MNGDIVSIVSTVGFPIFACCAMGYFCKYLIDEMRKSVDSNTQAVKELVTSIHLLAKGDDGK